ncbi:MAG TPA: MFS transporter [Verrucomicrobiae bacterium]
MAQVTRPERCGPTYKWWVIAMLWSVCFFNYADRQSIYSVFPKLKEQFGFDKVQLGIIGSAFMWVYAFGGPIAGLIGDRFRRKDIVLGGCVFWSVVTVFTGWCGKFWQFVVVRAMEGFGESFYFPASISLASDYHGPRTRSRALSIHQSSIYLGTIAGGWAGGWFAEHLDWRDCFFAFGGVGILLGIALWKFLREPRRGASEDDGIAMATLAKTETQPLSLADTLRLVFRRPIVFFLMAAFLCANFVATIFLVWTPTFLAEKFGFKLAAAGLSGSIFIHLASVVSVPLAGMLADWAATRFAGGRILVQAFGLLVGTSFVFLVGWTTSVSTLLAAMTCFGFCKGIYDSCIFASLCDFVEPRGRATATGIMNTIGWGGGGLGPLFLGWFAQHGGKSTEMGNMSAAISYCGAFYIVGALLLLASLFFLPRKNAN